VDNGVTDQCPRNIDNADICIAVVYKKTAVFLLAVLSFPSSRNVLYKLPSYTMCLVSDPLLITPAPPTSSARS